MAVEIRIGQYNVQVAEWLVVFECDIAHAGHDFEPTGKGFFRITLFHLMVIPFPLIKGT